ncbi:MAG: NAD(P)-dependent oxidoreductase [Blastocatellales bacterium]
MRNRMSLILAALLISSTLIAPLPSAGQGGGAQRAAMREIPGSQKFLIANETEGSPDKKGWYYHVLNVADTPEGMLCVYRKTDAHTALISDIMSARSTDGGRTWTDHKLISQSDVWNEGGLWVAPQLTKLRDGRLVIIADFGRRTTGQDWPMLSQWQKPDRGMSNHLFWSKDNGKTWGRAQLAPIYAQRPIIRRLQSGKLFVTYRNSWGTPGTYAFAFDQNEKLPYQPSSFIWDESRTTIKDGAMTIKTEEGRERGVIFALYPAQAPDSRVEIEAELRVEQAAANGVHISAGCGVRFETNRISLTDKPEEGFELDTTRWRKYRIIREPGREAGTISVFVDGELKMKRGAFLYNVSRGGIVDERALLGKLRDGSLGGAALDVFEQEPLPADNPFWALPNVIITPHLGAAWGGMWDAAFDLFCENLRRFRAGEPLINVADLARGY